MLYTANAQTDGKPVAVIGGEPSTGTFWVKPLMHGDTMSLLEVRVRAGAASRASRAFTTLRKISRPFSGPSS